MKTVLLVGEDTPSIPSHSWTVTRNPADRPDGRDIDVAVFSQHDETIDADIDSISRFRADRPLVPCVVTRRPSQTYNLDLARISRVYVIKSDQEARTDWFLRKAVGQAQLPPEIENLSADDLPVLPSSMMEIIDGLDDPDISPREAARLVELDPAITARVLALANSSFYAVPRRIGNAVDATMLLGLAVLRRTVLAAAVFGTFERLADPEQVERLRQLSLLRTQIVSKMVANPDEELATASLLMDVGRLAQLAVGNQPPRSLFPNTMELDAEAAQYGMDSGMVAARLLELWGMPVSVCTAVACAWWPEPNPTNRGGAHLVRVASALAAEAMGEMASPTEQWLTAIGEAQRYHEWREHAADLAIQWPTA